MRMIAVCLCLTAGSVMTGHAEEARPARTAYQAYRAERITPAEEELLGKGVSDGGFHYLGSARIMAGIGKGFAEAMMALQEKRP